ncbi:MAG: sulfatase-like hydrolase/transferase [Bacteroidota bacterium]
MMRYLSVLLLSFWGLTGCAERSSLAQAPPNIVFLFADDLTYQAIHALGNQTIKTPNLDRLVKEGTTFTHAYNMGAWNGAVCAASRAMLNSGRSVWRANRFRQNWIKGDSTALQHTWSKLMAGAGYDTYMTGKWHVDAKADLIFDHARHIRPGMPKDRWEHFEMVARFAELEDSGQDPQSIMPLGYNRPLGPNDKSWLPTDTAMGGFWEGGKHWSEVLKDDALDFIAAASAKADPFFMYLAFNAPHDPRQAPQSYLDQYPLAEIELPESWLAKYPYQDESGNGPSLRDAALAPFPRNEYATKVHIKEYYAIITHLDAQIGKILDALEQSGTLDNTYIFFSADHGLALGEHGLMGKQNMYDHSIRVPLMVKGPSVPQGGKISADVYLQDIMATTLELAGVPKPEYLEFNSFLDLTQSADPQSHYQAIYGCYIDFQRMIRKDDFKLIVYPKAQKVRLFDLNADPHEMQDLSDQPEYKAKSKQMFGELMALQAQMEDTLDLADLYDLTFKD